LSKKHSHFLNLYEEFLAGEDFSNLLQSNSITKINKIIRKNLNKDAPYFVFIHEVSGFLMLDDFLKKISIISIFHNDTKNIKIFK
jgi:hypothetical protein